ncbi:MAG: metal ABC transporter substrate-binding protein [Treponema sp.]|jgi:zinc transport system substrate-binding protein|nr:metal ABC transporter substrate-binding protein [Treponema sp.]
MKPRKILALIAVLFAGLGLIQCEKRGVSRYAVPENDKITVATTIFPPFDFTRAIAGDMVNLFMLLPPASESHSYEPTPQDIIKIQNCNIFIYGGGESDAWVQEILESIDNSKMERIALMETVEAAEEFIAEGMQKEDENQGEPEYDEHVWTAPKNAKRIVKAIAEVLGRADPVHAGMFNQNAEAYLEKLDALDRGFQETVDNGLRKTFVFGDRFPFQYFANAYRLEYFAAFPGCSTETEPNAATVAFLINKIRSEKIPVIFHIELSNERMADIISEETGAKKRLFHACHNISKQDFEQGRTYLDFMNQNLHNLKEALE